MIKNSRTHCHHSPKLHRKNRPNMTLMKRKRTFFLLFWWLSTTQSYNNPFLFLNRNNKITMINSPAKKSSSLSMSQDEVFDLVVEYLSTKGFSETASMLKSEATKSAPKASKPKGSRLEDLLEKSYVTELASGEFYPKKIRDKERDEFTPSELGVGQISLEDVSMVGGDNEAQTVTRNLSIETKIIAFNPCENDPHGSSCMPIYQTATFAQPSATQFGEYDYTRSGNPTRDALQNQIASLEGVEGARAFCFTTGMAALAAVTRIAQSGDEVIVNDDSYGGTYRLMSKVAAR